MNQLFDGCGKMIATIIVFGVGMALVFALANAVAPVDQLHQQHQLEQMERIQK